MKLKTIIALTCSIICSFLLILLTKLLSPSNTNWDKSSQFESGFEPLASNRKRVELRFGLIGILFLIFDIEIIIIVPFGLIIGEITNQNQSSFWVSTIFVLILTIGLIYEWTKGALNWD